jgi:hypothetical protein
MIPKPFEDQQHTILVSFLRSNLRPHFFPLDQKNADVLHAGNLEAPVAP